MCSKLNLPMFLFNVGLLTLMNMDSLIFLAKLERTYFCGGHHSPDIVLSQKHVLFIPRPAL